MKYLFFACLSFLLFSCGSDFDSQLLMGKWKTVSWTNLATGQKMNNQMDFQFENDGRYLVDYGTVKEKGEYWLTGEYLHTVEDGLSEKKVKIISLSQDSMVFEMNRAGVIEKVVLIQG